MRTNRRAFIVACCLLTPSWAAAQSWSFDARSIALGGAGDGNVAVSALESGRNERILALPIGLIQVFRNIDVFRPGSNQFDLIKAIEYTASPLHYVIGRDAASEADSGRTFSVDVRNARLSRDLNAYRGLRLSNQPTAIGLASPSWGGTIKVHRGANDTFHGIYLGAGPYVSLRSTVSFDQRLIDLLASDADTYLPNARLPLGNQTAGQAAGALTIGYRSRLALPVASTGAIGALVLAVNVNLLHGFRYEQADTELALDTDRNGLLTIAPAAGPPLAVSRSSSTSGRGYAIDLGVGAVVERWAVALGIRGIANRIEWTDVERTTYRLGNIFAGDATFLDSGPLSSPDVRVELPVDTHVSAAYRADAWSAIGEVAHGFQGTSVRTGYERKAGPFDLRGGTYYTRQRWQPTAGVGLNFGPRVALDLAIFGTSANAARQTHAAIAASLRFRR